MPIPAAEIEPPTRRLAKRAIRSTFVGMLVNLVLACVKGLTGMVGNSYALLADAMESLLDVFKAMVVLGGVSIAAAEPDRDHPYGHGKAEPIAAVLVALGLIAGAVGLAVESVQQIIDPGPSVPAPFTLAVLVAVIVTKEVLYRYVFRVGEEVTSTAVKTDAWHHRSDAITSGAALIGVGIAVIGGPAYASADAYAALFACFLIGYNGYHLLMPALAEVMDAAPDVAVEHAVREVALAVPRVVDLDVCLVRKMGFEYFVDLHVGVDGGLSVREGHDVAHRVKDAIRAANPRIRDVLIHIEPAEQYRERR